MAIIVNADDFGMNETVNKAICLAFEEGLIDRTTLMANMPAAKEAMEIAIDKGFIDRVGIHLNLTSGMPLTKGILSDPLMCGEGGFTGDFARSMKTRFYLPKRSRALVEEEIRAQFDAFRKFGGRLWHIDSHHHVHTDPSIWMILKRVMKDYPIVSVRLGRNMFRGGSLANHAYKAILNSSIRRYCKDRPRYFGSASDYRDFFGQGKGDPDEGPTEIMVHPVFTPDGKLMDEYEGKYYPLAGL